MGLDTEQLVCFACVSGMQVLQLDWGQPRCTGRSWWKFATGCGMQAGRLHL